MPKCPICKNVALQPAYFDNHLPVIECDSCGGAWLRANEYALWLKTQPSDEGFQPNSAEAGSRLLVNDSDQAAVCPDCGHFLRKYKIASNIDFQLDRCNHCNGVWFDHNEWEALKMEELHHEINQVFTKPWQAQIRDEITARNFDARYLERFGEHDYEKIKEIREWLEENPNRNTLIAYLLDQDPYGG